MMWISACAAIVAASLAPRVPTAISPAGAMVAAVSETATQRDGRHDFDAYFGSWKVHHRRLRHPLSGSNEWYEFDGTLAMRGILGFANMDENVLDMPTGRVYGIGIRLYSEKTHAWSIYYGTNTAGAFALPPTVGGFDADGVGRFYDREDWDGKPILVRFLWTHPTPDTAHWEQAFSLDDGRTWEANWIQDLVRP